MIGRKFGRLTVLKDSGKRTPERKVIWTCRCDCGKIHDVIGLSLTQGKTKSCGCIRGEGGVIKHGDARTGKHARLYGIWSRMKARCYKKSDESYPYYGARGIKLCPSWFNDYPTFKSWAFSHGYQDNLTIDRINNKGNYEPSNCQWLTNSENVKKAMIDRRIKC